jgi:hypothetical protein
MIGKLLGKNWYEKYMLCVYSKKYTFIAGVVIDNPSMRIKV